jgi:hypothetical protein
VARMFMRPTPMAATELFASPPMLSPCHRVSGRNDVIYPPEFEEGEFCELRPGTLPQKGNPQHPRYVYRALREST